MRDNDQYVISDIKAYRGDPLTRTAIEFDILSNDNTLTWIPWNKDLFDTIPYEIFCRSHSQLYPLIFTLKDSLTQIIKYQIFSYHHIVYVDLPSNGSNWYSRLPLPDPDHSLYVVELLYTNWAYKYLLKLDAYVSVFNENSSGKLLLDSYFVHAKILPNKMTLITPALILKYTSLLPSGKSSAQSFSFKNDILI